MQREPNKAYWQGAEVTDYERKQRLLVPRKEELLDTIVDYLPFDDDQELHILDVGAGQGALTERLLARFSRARVTLLDSSEEMLAVARQRLEPIAPRITTLVGDFNAENWLAPVERPVDAVVSSIALHYLRSERRLPFFRSVYDLLGTPGCLLNGGAFNTADPFVQEHGNQHMLEYTQERLLATEGKQVTVERLRENTRRESERAGINRMALREQVALLEAAGFGSAEIIWRYLLMAVVGAYKR